MSDYSPSRSAILIEEVIAKKKNWEAEISFEPGMLEVKPNRHGINGVFTRHAIPLGSNVLSVPVKNGTLTPTRAYEEAQDLLQKLDANRDDLGTHFIIASAMYLRYMNPKTKDSDLLVTETDFRSSYSGSPVTCIGSKEFTLLLTPNNKEKLDKAIKQDANINKMGVDQEVFRAMLGYAFTRCFCDYGIIPVFDWLNSAYDYGNNGTIVVDGDHIHYKLTRDVEAGEELTWSYNDHDALLTWINYGYRDYERPTVTFLELSLSEDQLVTFEHFICEKLTYLNKDHVFPSWRIDKSKMSFTLINPGNLPSPSLKSKSIEKCILSFIEVRTIFQAFIMSSEPQDPDNSKGLNPDTGELIFDIDIERKVISCMLSSLKKGLSDAHQRVEQFKMSEVGRSIDMAPFIEMIEEANAAWSEALTLFNIILSTDNTAEFITAINSGLNLNIKSEDEIKSTLKKVDNEQPTLLTSLVATYFLGK